MSIQQKTLKVAQYLPANKDIFVIYAQFQSQQQKQDIKNKYFDQNITLIAKMMVEAIYANKDIEEIDQIEIITDLQEWLSNSGVKFEIPRKTQPKPERVERKHEMPQQRVIEQQQPVNRTIASQNTLSPRPQPKEAQQSMNNFPSPALTYMTPQTPQNRPQTYYHNPLPAQGRPTAVKYVQKQQQQAYHPVSNQNLAMEQPQHHVKRHQNQKQYYGWVDNLYRCLTYPQRRYYILPEMHPKRKF